MTNERYDILAMHRTGKRQIEIARLLKVPKQKVSYVIARYKELGHEGDRPGRGRKRTANTSRNRKIIKKRVMRNPRVSIRNIARETGISHSSVYRMAKKELNLKPYKLRKGQLLTDANKAVRLQKCMQLLHRAAGERWEKIVFTDEKLFTIEQCHNHQNDRIWSTENPGPSAIVTHRQKPQSVMVWAGICASGKTPLIFLDNGVKMNQEMYRRDILEAVVLPWAQQHFGDDDWTFQQDSAPAHRAKATQKWCKSHFPDFITSAEWPPYSPDLNPMDYSIWSILEARACSRPHKSLMSLKQSLRQEWSRISLNKVRPIAENFRKRLQLCIDTQGGHFETTSKCCTHKHI